MINTQYIRLNMIPSGVMPTLYCSQYDVGRPLGIVVYNGSESVDLSEYTCTIEATRTDGTPITAGVTTDGNIGVFESTATMTNQADTYRGKLVLSDGNGNRVASLAFVMCINVRTMDENAEEIEEDASLYHQYTATVQTIIAQIRAQLVAEASARQAADQTLQQNINAEASARQAADNTLQSNINAEASTRAAADQNLQAQISQIVAPSGEAPSAAEVQNARVGADGVTYPTLGDAIRANDSQLKNAIGVTNSEIGIYEASHYANDSLRWAIIPFSFVNGQTYFIDVKNSLNNLSEVRISSAANLSNDSKIVSWSASGTSFQRTYTCSSNNAAYLIIITPSTNTSIAVDYAICKYNVSGIDGRVATLETGVATLESSVAKDELKTKMYDTISFQKKKPEISVSGSSYVVKFYVNSANASGFIFQLNGAELSFSPTKYGTSESDGSYSFTLTTSKALVVDPTDRESNSAQIKVKDLRTVSNTDALLVSYFASDQVSTLKGVLADYLAIDSLNERVTVLENTALYPSYYDTDNYLKNKIEKINEGAPANGAVLAFITDLHFGVNQMNSKDLLKYIEERTALSTILCGGDFIDAYGSDALLQTDINKTMEYAKALYPNWFALRGNHDFTIRASAESSSGSTIGDGITYNTIVRSCADWRYEVPVPDTAFFDAEYNMNKNYCWTLTNDQAKIRVIAFCDFNRTNTEAAYWGVGGRITNAYAKYLAQMLLASDGYSIILLTHAPITNKLGVTENNIITVVKKFVARESVTLGGYVMDFTNSTGILICSLSGHTHQDQFAFADGFLSVNTTCDATFNNDPNVTRTAGTISEQAFDVMNIDTDNKTLECVRIGGGYDRLFHYEVVTVFTSQTVTSGMSGTLSWNTSDSSVATVSDGTITKVASGECYVYATDVNGNKEYWAVNTN